MDKRGLIEQVAKFKGGDKESFEIIYIETNNKLFNYIFSLSDSLNNDDCFNILQFTYVQVHDKIHQLKK